MMRMTNWLRVALALFLPLCGAAAAQSLSQTSGPWVLEQSGATASLRGIHAVGGGVAWASGANGTVLRTEDGGYEWQSCAMPPGAEKLDFRGIWAWDDNAAIVISSGPGDQSRLYRTTDGCSSWKLILTNPDKEGFWDAILFSGRQVGYLLGDPVNGAFFLMRTSDAGMTWTKVQSAGLTTDGLSLGAFAAGNSALADAGLMVNALLPGDGRVWFGAGGAGGAFLYMGHSDCPHGGRAAPDPSCLNHWTFRRQKVPIASGEAAGVFSLGILWWDEAVKQAVAVGGDYSKPNVSNETAVWTTDGGLNWIPAVHPPHGYRSSVAWDAAAKAWIAAGTNGSDISCDGGKTWQPLDNGSWNALSLPWIVGPGGRIAKLDSSRLKP